MRAGGAESTLSEQGGGTGIGLRWGGETVWRRGVSRWDYVRNQGVQGGIHREAGDTVALCWDMTEEKVSKVGGWIWSLGARLRSGLAHCEGSLRREAEDVVRCRRGGLARWML